MKIADLLNGSAQVFSFEFFPPKSDKGLERLYARIEHLAELNPSFVSVTYAAGGVGSMLTLRVAERIKKELGIEVVAHLTCFGHTRNQLIQTIKAIEDAGIENVLALRGDAVPGIEAGDLRNANELIELISQTSPNLCVGAACYPESHTESSSAEDDIKWLANKVNTGADFLITQLFFENAHYFDFLKRARAAGISVPVLPGLMPVTDVSQIERFTKMCGATIPERFIQKLNKWRDDEQAVMALGIEWTIRQGRELLALGAPGLHFYTLNKSLATRVVHASLSGAGRWA